MIPYILSQPSYGDTFDLALKLGRASLGHAPSRNLALNLARVHELNLAAPISIR